MVAVLIRLLGGFEVDYEGRTVAHRAWRLRKAKTLVKLLALEPTHRLHKDQVTDRLWPERDPDHARNNLHQVLHAARRAVETVGADGPATLALRDDLVVLGAGCPVSTDVEEFQCVAERARAVGDTAALVAALERWPTELLPEDGYEPWVRASAEGLRAWRGRLVMDLVDGLLAGGDPEGAVAVVTPVVSATPLNEAASRALMRALTDAGRRTEALLVFERLREALGRELAADPAPPTLQLYRRLLAGGGEPVSSTGRDARDAPGRTRGPAHLPAAVTPLVGRERELRETARALGRTRLLTLIGPGGAGKTTLAVELARRHAPRYADGAVLVELGALADPELIVPEIARILGVAVHDRRDALDSLAGRIRPSELLVVLDNCEHLVEGCARIAARLLRDCPKVSVLATSREPLRTAGELTWRIPSLGLPDPARRPDLAALAVVPAVALFVERASAVAAGFALTETTAGPVAEICYRLDGLPLALELAAACIPTLSPAEVAARLGETFSLLNRGDRSKTTRQQTLAATLAWSHDLLAGPERVLYRRLSVFAGSFALDAAEMVAAGAGLDAAQVVAALARLIDMSLVLAEPDGPGRRYRMLQTVRQDAADRLRAAREHDPVHARHGAWYAAFAQANDPERTAATDTVGSAAPDAEHDNLRVALRWLLRHDPAGALAVAVAMRRYWLTRCHFAEGRRWLEEALEAAPEPSPVRARALLAIAVLDVRRGKGRRLAALGAEVVAIHRGWSDPTALGEALHADGVLAYVGGDWDRSRDRCRQARAAVDRPGGARVVAATLDLDAMVALGRGDLAGARRTFGLERSTLEGLPAAAMPFFTPVMLGYAVEGSGSPTPRVFFEETVMLGRRVNAGQALGYLLSNLAYLERLAGDLDEALILTGAALATFGALEDLDGQALALNHRGCLHRVRGEFDEGRAALERSLRMRRAVGDRRAAAVTRNNLGVLAASAGDVDGAIATLRAGLAEFDETQDAPATVATQLTMASVYADAGRYDQARQLLSGILDGSRCTPGHHRAIAWGYALLSDVQVGLGEADEAAAAAREAAERLAALGAVAVPDRTGPAPAGAQTRG